jgi:UDPglucose 6-dehydrogenase
MSKVAIYGWGYVGQGMNGLFPDAAVSDPPRGLVFDETSDAGLHIICVPTPQRADDSCDTSAVEQVIAGIPDGALVLIKSTVPPGTTQRLSSKHRIVFSPEYMGEGGYYVPPQFPDPHSSRSHGFMVLGGDPADCSAVVDIFIHVMGPTTRFRFMAAHEAEAVKYFENAYLALKVVFANEMRRFCEQIGANYHLVREGWLDDPRVGTSHSAAFNEQRGFNGKCLPKDLAALRAVFKSPLLDAVHAANKK